MRSLFTLGSATGALAVAAVFLAGAMSLGSESWGAEEQAKVRKPAVAGMFYPSDKQSLERVVKDSLNSAIKEKQTARIKAVLAPHAGYVYCGPTMAAAFKQIEGEAFTYDRVVMIGPSHGVRTKAAAVSSANIWETPLGPVPVDTKAARKFVEISDRIEYNDLAHAAEHSLEVQLPYLIVAAGGRPFRIVPVLTNSSDPSDQEIVARALVESAADPKTLILISSDLSHFPNGNTAERVDKQILNAVTSLKPETLLEEDRRLMKAGYPGLECTMCGLEATLCVVRAAAGLGIATSKVLSCTHSGMTSGDARRVVGYGAVVFMGSGEVSSKQSESRPELTFSEHDRRELLSLARSAVKAAVERKRVEFAPSDNSDLQVKAGCFVTLKNKGRLRGCIGCFQSDAPLWKTVCQVAVSSATRDYRFARDPIVPEEIPDLDIEISVLSPLHSISEPLKDIKLGRDGIVIRDGEKGGTFLPQVATETGWTLEEFLGHCSRDKAGLGWDGWKKPTARIYTYTVTMIREKDATMGQSR